ncbi:hypothetical protein LJC48_00980 [Desulfovibrio sp. OttesenSCG-928-C06]|nr:hypothetical protein [Desulfovibrio sp. OttesenSCG-928-C06]
MRYAYDTEEGIFTIRQNQYETWDLYMDAARLGNYACPEAAAQDVALGVTGHWDWDRLRSKDELKDLAAWKQEE